MIGYHIAFPFENNSVTKLCIAIITYSISEKVLNLPLPLPNNFADTGKIMELRSSLRIIIKKLFGSRFCTILISYSIYLAK